MYYSYVDFNCDIVALTNSTSKLIDTTWLSWGNSWISLQCNWRDLLLKKIGFNISEPAAACLSFSISGAHVYILFILFKISLNPLKSNLIPLKNNRRSCAYRGEC